MERHASLGMTAAQTLTVSRFHIRTDEMATIGQQMAEAFTRAGNAITDAGAVVTGPATACYEPADDGFDVAAGFPTSTAVVGDGVESLELPSGEVARMTHAGSYEALASTYDALREDVERQGRHLADGLMWEQYVSGPEVPTAQTRTEVYWPMQAVSVPRSINP